MKHIVIGSTNPTKIESVKIAFQSFHNVIVEGVDVPSGVSDQPFSDEETRLGAINRSRAAKEQIGADIGIGLEGGVYEEKEGLYLCNWGALYAGEDRLFTAGGARILLPEEVAEGVRKGKELAHVMEQYVNKRDVRSKEGAIGIFTNDLIRRKDMFAHIVLLLVGQYEYKEKTR